MNIFWFYTLLRLANPFWYMIILQYHINHHRSLPVLHKCLMYFWARFSLFWTIGSNASIEKQTHYETSHEDQSLLDRTVV